MVKEAYENRRTVYLVGASGIVEDRLLRLKILRRVLEQNPVDTRLEALETGIVLVSQRQVNSSNG